MSFNHLRKLLTSIPIILSLGCTKIIVVAQENKVVDTVFVVNSKIYSDTVAVNDTVLRYILKYANPVISLNAPDPSIIKADNGVFYLYSTESSLFPNVPIFKSVDLVNWFFVGTAFNDKSRPNSFEGNIWAPDINYINEKYVLYYAMSRWGGEWDCGIGVAVADYPWGPFLDNRKLFDSKEIGILNSIDPFFIEDRGKKYLFWGSHHGIYGMQLSDDGLSLKQGAEKTKIAGDGGEGTYIHRRGGYYYLFLSYGSCCDGLSSTYHICVGRSNSILGPYLNRDGKPLLDHKGKTLLRRNDYVAAPGHNSEIITDDNGEDWLLYHGYLYSSPELNRLVFLDKITWDDDWPIMQGAPSKSSRIPLFVQSLEENGNSN